METPSTTSKKSFFQNDRLLVCSMLAFYGLCILGCVAAVFWGLNRTNQTLSASATSTAIFQSAQQANATATAIVHATELAQYEIIDPFDVNINNWRMGAEDNDLWTGSTQVTSGLYIWYVKEVKKGFFARAGFNGPEDIQNYSIYVDTKLGQTFQGKACSGLIFRVSPLGWSRGGYSFTICNAGYFIIYYHNTQDGWQEVHSQYHPIIQPLDWNRLEVLADDSHFEFLINGQSVYEMDDNRQPAGGVGLMINANDSETKIFFDNFGFQSR